VALLAVPNISAGRDARTIGAVADAFTSAGARLLDVHSDADHNRSVFTLTGGPSELTGGIVAGARECITRIDLRTHSGAHPLVGALDVAPIVYTDVADRGAAVAAALLLADRLGDELNLPVFLYGQLAGSRSRAELRRGGPAGLAARVATGVVRADFGPRYGLHPTAGATLVSARPPLVAFNLELAPPADLALAHRIAARIREGGEEGLAHVRAIAVELTRDSGPVAQISTNLESWEVTSPGQVLEAVRAHHPVAGAELVGLAPAGAFGDFPEDVHIANLRLIEDRLGEPDEALP
jgi:glutamate formiminotransferase / 5-formyltetrahydrofolate cyclo-ligase